jgi:hypothetical protein
VLWGGARGGASGTSGGASTFAAPRGGALVAALNSSLGYARVVVLADGSTVGASASSAAPALQALDAAGAPSWLLPLGVVPGASAASYVSSVSACGASSTVLLAVVLPSEGGMGPPLYDWLWLAAVDAGASPAPALLWTRNVSAGVPRGGPPGAAFAACAAGVAVLRTPDGGVSTFALASGAALAAAPALAAGTGAACVLTPDARVLACPSAAAGAGGAAAFALLGAGGPALAWTAAGMGWSLGDGGAPSPPAYDAPSDTFLFSNFSLIAAAARDGALRWRAPLPPGALVSAALLLALPPPPNAAQVAVAAANLQGGDKELGTVWALDMRSGAQLALGALPDGAQLTSALAVDATGANVLVNAWDLTLDATAAFVFRFDRLAAALTVVGASPWRYAPGNDDIFPAFALAGDGQLLVQYAGAALARLQPALPRPPCAWSRALPGQYVPHCADDGCVPHAALGDAQAACAAALTCGGLTNDPATGAWQLRAGPAAAPSANGETAYLVTNAQACHER